MQFDAAALRPTTKQALANMGYETATPIQADTIPLLMQGLDVIGRAQTGTGKTAAFGVPMVDQLSATEWPGVKGLILVPTRELAIQVHDVLTDIAQGTRLNVIKAFGGTGFQQQLNDLRKQKVTILVACPGRLLDLVGRGAADLSKVTHLVLDEADRMLDMGFIHDVRKILDLLPADRQNALFSATLDDRVKKLAAQMLNDPETIEIEMDTLATELTEQRHSRVEKNLKKQALLGYLHAEQPHKAVVFTRTKHLAKRLAKQLSERGWSSVDLQGNLSQNARERNMSAFREGKARLLIATDVAARGLDVPDISHVVNYDIPNEEEQYIHRVGRTGRNGATGKSMSFVQSDQAKEWQAIKRLAGTQIPHVELSTEGSPRGPDARPEPSEPKQHNKRPASHEGARRHPRRPQSGGKPGAKSGGKPNGARQGNGGQRNSGGGQGGRSGGPRGPSRGSGQRRSNGGQGGQRNSGGQRSGGSGSGGASYADSNGRWQ